MKVEIKNRWSGEVLFSIEADSWKIAVEAAIKAKANLSEADLSRANLRPIKHDVWGVLLHNKNEVAFLRKAIISGKVDGSTYSGTCACLCGTLAKAKGINDGSELPIADSSSLSERFFLAIRRGDTPKNNPVSKIVLRWIDEFEVLIK